ncbi:hypothetical protein D3C80_1985130 [compost metagenome]
MMPRSAGSNASASPSVLEVTMLIHSTCAGVSGNASSNRMAAITTRASPPLVGNMNRMNFFRLS